MRQFPFDRVNWGTSSFLIITFFISLIGTPLYFIKYGVEPFLVIFFLLHFVATGMGITLGYHRLFAHRSFKAKVPVRLATLIFGASAFEDSALDWASDHRDHHKHTDHDDDDPYSISKGFFWAHIGWIFFKLYPRELNNVNDLRKDKLVMWQHKYHLLIGFTAALVLPAIICYLWRPGWEGILGGLLVVGITKVVAVQHCTFFINSLCHTIGKQPYCSNGSARDSWIMALFTFGEGYHNYHHAFQHDYRNGIKKFHWDPTKWMIFLLSKLGLTSELREVSPEKIMLAELREAKRQADEKISWFSKLPSPKCSCPKMNLEVQNLKEIYEKLHEHYNVIEQSASDRIAVSKERLEEARENIAQILRQITVIDKMATV